MLADLSHVLLTTLRVYHSAPQDVHRVSGPAPVGRVWGPLG